ncbi:protein meaA [Turneriella parva]|uniref:(R)-ethylmalonyl-CoA mutase n=1 Tax=Turneriella parva (strain ATCC BAA-1111 / DSM 21527 / NCTC 11395 / H) TaxID=869212 RepID=I4B0Y3_TURPD|nr:protein meaA [Turneriella parva]AFM10940.1 (R)-ethylmalonyl-CoA mutase [Turneriella parva DSM 21527]
MAQEAHKIYNKEGVATREEPWIFRTYGGHSNARATNELYRTGLARGQTGLSIAFDLATQCGYDSDHPMARPEVGKVGVPINSLLDFRMMFDQIPLEKMNTSMTINGTAMWLLSLYIALAEERGIDPSLLQGTTQNDIIKEYLARGTYIFPPESSIRLIVDMYEYCVRHIPKWNPSNICSYHLQEAGATPVQELSFALVTAIAILDAIKERNCFSEAEFEQAVGRISFFVNSGMRFIEEMCKMRAFGEMWDDITKNRYGVKTEKYRRFRYGVQVNSLGLTEEQPENNAWRILIEALGVTISQKARCRALQLPAWNEALSLPRPWDQQWSLRMQQVMAYETDLLEYPDIFDGSPVIQSKVLSLMTEAKAEIEKVLAQGGAVEAIKSGYMKSQLVKSQAERMSRIMTGDLKIVGRNIYSEGLPSPLLGGADSGIFKVDHSAADETLATLKQARETRDNAVAEKALQKLEADAKANVNLMPASIACAKALVTTGEWANTLRKVFGEYRPLTGVEGQKLTLSEDRVVAVRKNIEVFKEKHGHRPRFVLGKPGLDGHSNGAEMVAVAARHVGFDVIYSGIRLTPEEIARAAVEENADLIAMSILSGSHVELVDQLMKTLVKYKAEKEIPLVVGGIIPESDFGTLKSLGVQHIFTPKDYDLIAIMEKNLEIAEAFA